MLKILRLIAFIVGVILACGINPANAVASIAADDPGVDSSRPPNIVFILADDLGFSDTQPYGGEVNTPTINYLAAKGVAFTNYHTAANCAPSRAMLLTGVNNHLAGVPNIPEMLAPEQRSASNYQGVLGDNVVTVATLLESAGYHTYMAGKWHLGKTPGKKPSERGFSRTVALMDSGADNWEQKPYIPLYDEANWFADGKRLTLPEDFYSSEYLVDSMIGFIDENLDDNKPFFAYLPFMAVHIPVQAPQEFIDRYEGVYKDGWDKLRKERLKRAVSLGIVPEGIDMQRMSTTLEWDNLDMERQRYESKRMAVYAGMIEAMDFNLGRLIDFLRAKGEYENTVFIFTSDNGTEASGSPNPQRIANRVGMSRMGYNVDYETMGLKGSYGTISPSFASASASPLSYYKFYAGEGGMRVPLIVAGEPIDRHGVTTNAFSWATDITPTILAIAGVAQPEARYAGRSVLPITGKDLMPVISGDSDHIYEDTDAIGYELAGNAALFQGDYKLVSIRPPLGDGRWRLFNIIADPGETKDLAALSPKRFQSMLSAYERFKRENAVLPLPEGYDHLKQLVSNTLRSQMRNGILVALITALILVPFAVFSLLLKRSLPCQGRSPS